MDYKEFTGEIRKYFQLNDNGMDSSFIEFSPANWMIKKTQLKTKAYLIMKENAIMLNQESRVKIIWNMIQHSFVYNVYL